MDDGMGELVHADVAGPRRRMRAVGESDHLLAGEEGTDLSCDGAVLNSNGERSKELVVEYVRPQQIAEELHRFGHVMEGADLLETALCRFQPKITLGVRDGISDRRDELHLGSFQHAASTL
jgi:hypothetical protein